MLSSSGLPKEDKGYESVVQTDSVIAWVLGRSVSRKDSQNLSTLIISPLLDRYAHQENIEVTEKEIKEFTRRSREIETKLDHERIEREQTLTKELSLGNLSEEKRKAKEEELKAIRQILAMKNAPTHGMSLTDSVSRLIETNIAQRSIRAWKINRSLFRRYGGRVIFQQAGVEPVDAYRMFLREQERIGNFKILDPALSKKFWKYFLEDSPHIFVPEKDKERLIETPWW